MTTRTCIVCGTEIQDAEPGVDYCGEACRLGETKMKALTISQPIVGMDRLEDNA